MASFTVRNGSLYDNTGRPVFVNTKGEPWAGGGFFGSPFTHPHNPLEDIPGLSDAAGTIKDTATAAASTAKAVIAATKWISDRNNWIRVAKVIIGTFMIVEGIALLIGKSTISSQAVSTIAKTVK